MVKTDLREVMKLADAATKYGLDTSTIRKAITRGEFEEGTYKDLGRIWIVTTEGMDIWREKVNNKKFNNKSMQE